MKHTYDIKSKKVYFCLKSGTVTNRRVNKSDIRFDSKAEFDLYRYMYYNLQKKEPVNIKVHERINISTGCNWNIDFKLSDIGNKDSTFFRYLLDVLNDEKVYSKKLTSIYIEYKGVVNKEYELKQKKLFDTAPYLNKRIIILSDTPKCFLYEKEDLTYHIKKIHSVRYFKKVVSKW